MSKLKIVTAAGVAAVFATMLSLSTGSAIAADAAAPAAKADAAAPADPDAAAAPADAAADTAADAEAPAADAATAAAAPEQPAAAAKAAEPAAKAAADPAAKPADPAAKPAEPAAKPMIAPAAPAAAPQKSVEAPAPAKGAAAAQAASLTIGATVVGADGKEVGKVNRVSSGANGEITEIHVNTSGAAGLSGAIVAIPGGKIASGGDKVKLSMTSDEVSKLPKIGSKG